MAMDELEEVMPNMADILAAQESALASVFGALTAQLQHLATSNERQVQQIAQLESAQLKMRLAIKELEKSPSSEPVPSHMSIPKTTLKELQQMVQQQVTMQMQRILPTLQNSQTNARDAFEWTLLEQKLCDLDSKLIARMNRLRDDATSHSIEMIEKLEQAINNHLEQNKQQVDKLSRMKIETNELKRRADRQEQNIEDVRTGLELLAKSLDSDDADLVKSGKSDEVAGERQNEDEISNDPVKTTSMVQVRQVAYTEFEEDRLDEKHDEKFTEVGKEIEAPADASSTISFEQRRQSFSQSSTYEDTLSQRTEITMDLFPIKSIVSFVSGQTVEQPNENLGSLSTASAFFQQLERENNVAVAPTTSVSASHLFNPNLVIVESPTTVSANLITASETEGAMAASEPTSASCTTPIPCSEATTAPAAAVLTKLPSTPVLLRDFLTATAAVTLASHPMTPDLLLESGSGPAAKVLASRPTTPILLPESVTAPANAVLFSRPTTLPVSVNRPIAAVPASRPTTPVTICNDQVTPSVSVTGHALTSINVVKVHDFSAVEKLMETKQEENGYKGEELEKYKIVRERKSLQQNRTPLATRQDDVNDEVEVSRPPSTKSLTQVASINRARQRRPSTLKVSNVKSEDQLAIIEGPLPLSIQRSISSPSSCTRNDPRPPLTKAQIKELWLFLLAKLVRLNRLRQLSGSVAEDTLFRPQQTSMGSRVKRLEESSTRFDKSLDYMSRIVQGNSYTMNALEERLPDLQIVLNMVQSMERSQISHTQTLGDVEEKLQELDFGFQRLRMLERRRSSVSSKEVTNAVSAHLQDVSARLSHQISAFEASEKILTQVREAELPALHDKIDLSLYAIRQEADLRSKEVAEELRNLVEQVQTSQRAAHGTLFTRLNVFCNRIYQTLLGLSGAMLQFAKLVDIDQTSKLSSRSTFDVGIDLLSNILTQLLASYRTVSFEDPGSDLDVLVESSTSFLQQLEKLKREAANAKVTAQARETSGKSDARGLKFAQSSSFDDHLVFITTAKLKDLERTLVTQEDQRESIQTPELLFVIHDAVVQLRSVLYFLLVHSQGIKSCSLVEELRSSHEIVQHAVKEHGFTLKHLDSTVAIVKMMNARLDRFMELSFTYAKEDDVKNSIQELMTSNNDMQDFLSSSLEVNRSETIERDGLLGEEMNQLVARVNKKLDKDELLWTQEVLERQLQNIANTSLDDSDLVDIHRRLGRKMDKSQLEAVLQGHRGQLKLGSAQSTTKNDKNGQQYAPLVAAKCISCQGELPPTIAMIKSVVRDQIHQEFARSRTQNMSPSSLHTFNVSNHRNLGAFKKELLLAALQQQRSSSKKENVENKHPFSNK
ncbi:hypothetical protein Plhal710r2_c015g0066301 [Plasmopara halstedii]